VTYIHTFAAILLTNYIYVKQLCCDLTLKFGKTLNFGCNRTGLSVLLIYEHLNYNEITRGKDYIPAHSIHTLNSGKQSPRVSSLTTGIDCILLTNSAQALGINRFMI